MSTPTIELLAQHYPQAQISLVGSKVGIELFKRHTFIHNLYHDETKLAKNRFLATLQLAKTIGKHDIAITLQNNLPSALLLFLTRSNIRIGYRGNLRSPLLTHALKPQKQLHQVQQYLHLLTALNLSIPEDTPLKLPNFPIPHNTNIRIGINAGAKYGSAKRWCEEYFIELIAILLNRKYEVFLYGGSEESESNMRITQAIQSLAPTQLFHNLTNQTNISQLIDNIASLDLFVTNDSGPMHIASALGIPLLAIFGPTDATETSPYNSQYPQILLNKHLPCAPCKKRQCPLKHHQCMKLITPDEVLNSIDILLKR
ncbi:lipopolysaccharide heptosyltransferase II [Helicobacter enhydrae]|uniref:lipopolysaccharide heptosyltransferase II n=2 Tax=Helicobacter enhydrae TaxID=222136 RepID=A0A1B1U7L9_9HELI|nr:lipopolysaccharide heptosyltransferase II [Helicobacter enhydrae]